MRNLIRKKCKEIEKEKNVKILFCVESGSRAWRIESSNSDYDCRFVFVRSLDDYLNINKKEETIVKAYDKEGNSCPIHGSFTDFLGLDVYKFSNLLLSSNPTAIEWLESDILYYGNKNKVFIDFSKNYFNPVSLYYHYKSMCKQNYLKYLKSGTEVTYKKYLYAMRGLVNALYVSQTFKIPSIDFNKTLDDTNIPQMMKDKLKQLIKLKKNALEKRIIDNIVHIDEFIEHFLKDESNVPKPRKNLGMNRELNDEIKKLVKEVKK